jgi:hypothetical protein
MGKERADKTHTDTHTDTHTHTHTHTHNTPTFVRTEPGDVLVDSAELPLRPGLSYVL